MLLHRIMTKLSQILDTVILIDERVFSGSDHVYVAVFYEDSKQVKREIDNDIGDLKKHFGFKDVESVRGIRRTIYTK